MPTKTTKSVKRRKTGSAPGSFGYGIIPGRIAVPEQDRWDMFDALCRLHALQGRPVTREELARALNKSPAETYPYSLVMARYAISRKVPKSGETGFVPADLHATRLDKALRALNNLRDGPHAYTVRVGLGGKLEQRALRVDRQFRSRIRKTASRLKEHLGLRGFREVTSDQLPRIHSAVYELEMQRSLVPLRLRHSQSPQAKRARKSALNRQGDWRRFMEWAEHAGFLDLRFFALHNKSRQPMLTREWASFNALSPVTTKNNIPLTLARRAIAFGADTPERLAAMGFDRFESWLIESGLYSNRPTAIGTIGSFRRVWNERVPRSSQPEWPSPVPWAQEKLADGGLVRTWWSAYGFMAGNCTLLDSSDMAFQLRQATDMRDWWTLANPTTRPASAGGPLPPRPSVARPGGRRIGARSEDQPTASKPLWAVTRFQRFTITHDPQEAERISPEAMRDMDWPELFSDLGRLERFIRYEMQRSVDEHEGRLVKTQGTDSALYVSLLAESYFPAFVNQELERLEAEEADLDEDETSAARQRVIGRERKRFLRAKRQWSKTAKSTIELFRSEEQRLGGFTPKKQKDEIAAVLTHANIGRIADGFRDLRLDFEADLRTWTKALIKQVEASRASQCEADVAGQPCGQNACDQHHPLPEVRHGIATTLVTRNYAFLCMKELWVRLPCLIPWRPSEWCRLKIGLHLDPHTLRISVARWKNREQGRVARREADIQKVQPIAGMDPAGTEKTVESIRMCLALAQPYLAANPTRRVAPLKQRDNDEHLFLSKEGLALVNAKWLGKTIGGALQEGAKLVNSTLREGEEPIELPTGWGACASYAFRFLWGHRSVEQGASMGDVAIALGNTERTTREYYQAVRSDTAINSVAKTTKTGRGGANREEGTETGGGDYFSELSKLLEATERGTLDSQEFVELKSRLKVQHGR
jgi:hypothetical protein